MTKLTQTYKNLKIFRKLGPRNYDINEPAVNMAVGKST